MKGLQIGNWVVYNGKTERVGNMHQMFRSGNTPVLFNERVLDRCYPLVQIQRGVYVFEQGKYNLMVNRDKTSTIYFMCNGEPIFFALIKGIHELQNLYPFLCGRDELEVELKQNDLKTEFV